MKKLLVIIQFLLTITCLVLGIIYLAGNNKLYLDVLEITAGADLILMGISNYIIYKKTKVTILYVLVGVIMIMTVVLNKLGVI